MSKADLKYLVEDILEVKFRKNQRGNRKLATRLIKESRGPRSIQALSGFVMGDILLVIKDGEVPAFRKMVFLDAHTQKMAQIRDILQLAEPF